MTRQARSGFTRVPYVESCTVASASGEAHGLLCNLSMLGAYVTSTRCRRRASRSRLRFALPDGEPPVEAVAASLVNDLDQRRARRAVRPCCRSAAACASSACARRRAPALGAGRRLSQRPRLAVRPAAAPHRQGAHPVRGALRAVDRRGPAQAERLQPDTGRGLRRGRCHSRAGPGGHRRLPPAGRHRALRARRGGRLEQPGGARAASASCRPAAACASPTCRATTSPGSPSSSTSTSARWAARSTDGRRRRASAAAGG